MHLIQTNVYGKHQAKGLHAIAIELGKGFSSGELSGVWLINFITFFEKKLKAKFCSLINSKLIFVVILA